MDNGIHINSDHCAESMAEARPALLACGLLCQHSWEAMNEQGRVVKIHKSRHELIVLPCVVPAQGFQPDCPPRGSRGRVRPIHFMNRMDYLTLISKKYHLKISQPPVFYEDGSLRHPPRFLITGNEQKALKRDGLLPTVMAGAAGSRVGSGAGVASGAGAGSGGGGIWLLARHLWNCAPRACYGRFMGQVPDHHKKQELFGAAKWKALFAVDDRDQGSLAVDEPEQAKDT